MESKKKKDVSMLDFFFSTHSSLERVKVLLTDKVGLVSADSTAYELSYSTEHILPKPPSEEKEIDEFSIRTRRANVRFRFD